MTVSNGEIVKAVSTLLLQDEVVTQAVWYYLADFAADQSYAAVVTALKTEIETIYNLMAGYVNSTCVLSSLVVNKWSWDPVDLWHTGPLVGIDTLSDAFASATDMLPHAAAMVITGFSEDPNTRSRKSFPGFSEDRALDSDVTAATLAMLANVAGEWLSARQISAGNDLYPVIPSKAGTPEYLLYTLVSGLVGSQRQRKPGIGV